tara:strand:+ start:126 stop:572 length:447 start_codon:yes stop_codon:yes gene_type:complete
MGELVQRLPNYCPKINEILGEARDLDLTEMRREYPHGFICCGNEYLLGKFSQFRGQHMKSKKHQKNILDSATQEYKENLGDCDTLLEAFQKKCKENRELKKLNLQKQTELDRVLRCNIELQEEIKEFKKKLKPVKLKVKEENLIDLLS